MSFRDEVVAPTAADHQRGIRKFFERFPLHSETLLLLVVVFLLLAVNRPFWSSLLGARSFSEFGTWRFAVSSFVALAAFHFFLFGLFASRRLIRPILSVLVFVSILTCYYMSRYGVVIDPSMMRNVIKTDWREASELLNPAMFGYMLLGLVPVAAIWLVRLRSRTPRAARVARIGSLTAALAVGVIALLVSFQDFGSAMRVNKGIRYQLTPGNLLWSAGRIAAGDARNAVGEREPADPAHRVLAVGGARKPTLLVMVVGETARSANFGLNGYARMNTPELAGLDIVNFPHTTSCGTSTEVSVPCMFSPFGRADYDEDRIRNHESLLHLVDRAGLKVSWIDNQSGCKGVCSGLDFTDLGSAKIGNLCDDGHCYDEAMIQVLKDKLAADPQPQDRMVVMHQLGNHGPAYYRRYPKAFEKYTPACQNNDLGTCSQQEIVNAYDNAIAYTDHVLAQTIAFLKTQQDRYDVALIYVSDHGESLGEHGLFLHGVPYAIAPKEQTSVPMVWWMPEPAAHNLNVNLACLRDEAQKPASHDNLFSSVLGLLDIETPRYKKERDLFGACRADGRRIADAAGRPRV